MRPELYMQTENKNQISDSLFVLLDFSMPSASFRKSCYD